MVCDGFLEDLVLIDPLREAIIPRFDPFLE
jgi:hypothetical protein